MVSAVKNEPGRASDWLLYEEDEIGRYSRDIVTVAANQTLKCGAIVSLNADSTEVVEYDNTDTEAGAAVGIMAEEVITGADTVKGVIIARHAKVAPSGLVWKTGLSPADKFAAMLDLKAKGIIASAEA
jgi:hypothetical protein